METQTADSLRAQAETDVMPHVKFHPDFPKPGVTFMDLFSISSKPKIMEKLMDIFAQLVEVQIGKPGVDFDFLDPSKRYSTKQALAHPFFAGIRHSLS